MSRIVFYIYGFFLYTISQGRGELQAQQYGQQKPGDLLVAYVTADRVQRPRQIRGHEAVPGGCGADDDRPVSLPVLRRRRRCEGVVTNALSRA